MSNKRTYVEYFHGSHDAYGVVKPFSIDVLKKWAEENNVRIVSMTTIHNTLQTIVISYEKLDA